MKPLTIKERKRGFFLKVECLPKNRIQIRIDEDLGWYSDPLDTHLTIHQAERLRDWLDGWLQEQK